MTQSTTSERVLFHLKTRGSCTAKEIAAQFEITHMGAHKVLQGLSESGLIKFKDIASGRGRPKRTYELSEAGHARFPDRHSDLTVELIKNVRNIFGEEGLAKLIEVREKQQLNRYRTLQSEKLKPKIEHLAKMRAAEGYMAHVEQSADEEFMLIEDHCPICAAAETCQGFCRSELNIFEKILGPDVKITREEHILSGGRRCAYRIVALD